MPRVITSFPSAITSIPCPHVIDVIADQIIVIRNRTDLIKIGIDLIRSRTVPRICGDDAIWGGDDVIRDRDDPIGGPIDVIRDRIAP